MHSHQAGDDGVAGAVHPLRTRRDLRGRSRADGLNFATRDHDGLVVLRRSTCPIDDPNVVKNEDWRIDIDEVHDIKRFLGLSAWNRRNEQ